MACAQWHRKMFFGGIPIQFLRTQNSISSTKHTFNLRMGISEAEAVGNLGTVPAGAVPASCNAEPDGRWENSA